MVNKNLRVSIVIPVYNEAAHLPACLDAIARQSVQPYEVIVVDNNSCDDTAAIACLYPFVRLLTEKRQGVVYARDRGFDAVRGDIIGRIDADTIIADDWVAVLRQIFADGTTDAVTGSAHYYDMALSSIVDQTDMAIRRYYRRCLGKAVVLQGANMALRRSTWRHIRKDVCRTAGVHEDFDISIHASQSGYRVTFDETLVASLSFRSVEAAPADYLEYNLISPRTYRAHGLKRHVYMYPIVALAVVGYLPIRLLRRGYDAHTERFSLVRMLSVPAQARVNPGTFVD
ncbi:MAG TPA: glycosyltransferase family 2 protein [Candidatus Saccharimonadales bacterium]|jgi:glycosyltransferase involved in cell wall biosynthesis